MTGRWSRRCGELGAVVLAGLVGAAAGASSFAPAEFIPTGSAPGAVAMADVNGDGALDLVVLHQGAATMTTLLNDGRGGFRAAASAPTDELPFRLVLADLDGDGLIDAAVTNLVAGTVGVYRGDGAGAFERTQTIDVGALPRQILSADVTGDGLPDLVVTVDSVSGKIANDQVVLIIANLGEGVFQPINLVASVTSAQSLVHEDMDGDGVADLVLTRAISLESSVVMFRGDPLFHFLPFEAIPAMASMTHAIGADVDGDGDVDLVGVAFTEGFLRVALNDGGAEFSAQAPVTTSAGPLALVGADVDGDGAIDVVVLNRMAKSITLMRNDGAGVMTAEGEWSTGDTPNDIVAGDLDGDGDIDIVVASLADDGVYLHRNLTSERGAADLNGDGVIDGADLAALLATWGACATAPCAGDLNDDAMVDGADLAALLSLWD